MSIFFYLHYIDIRVSKRELHRYRFSQRVGIAPTLWTCSDRAFEVLLCLRTNAGRLCQVMVRVLPNSDSLFTSRLTIRRCVVPDIVGVVKYAAHTEVWCIDPVVMR